MTAAGISTLNGAPGSSPVLIHRVIARLNVGGPAMHVVNLARAMNEGPWRTRLVAGSIHATEGDMEYYATERGVVVTHIPELSRHIRLLDDVRALWALYRLFRRERPTVVHTHTAKAGTLGRLAAILAGVPVRVHTFHGHVLGGDYFGPLKTRFFLEIERQLARGTQRLVVLTRRQAREMSRELVVAPPERFAVIPLGLELERFRDADRAAVRAATRKVLGIGPDERVVGMVGRMVPIKNHELFLRVVAYIMRTMRAATASGGAGASPFFRFLLVGSGEREAHLKAYATSLGLGDEVLWMGWRRDLADLYPAMDVVVLTSDDEGTPVALLEALAAGTRVVARDVGGVAEVLADAGAGRVVPRDADARFWADVVAREAGADPLGEGGRRRVSQRFSVGRLAADMAALYREVGVVVPDDAVGTERTQNPEDMS